MPIIFWESPCASLMVVTKATVTGNCSLVHSNEYSFSLGRRMIRGMATRLCAPETSSFTLANSTRSLGDMWLKISRVPLHRPALGLRFRISMMGTPGFRMILCCGRPVGSRLLQYSTENDLASCTLSTASALLRCTSFPGHI